MRELVNEAAIAGFGIGVEIKAAATLSQMEEDGGTFGCFGVGGQHGVFAAGLFVHTTTIEGIGQQKAVGGGDGI